MAAGQHVAVARGEDARAPALATAASLAAVLAVEAFAPAAFAAHAVAASLLAIMALGLPHGVLDIRAVRCAFGLGAAATAGVLLLYVALAAATAALWFAAPVAALVAFLAIAAVHFAEDWEVRGLGPLAVAVPVAMFAAGAMRDRDAYDAIFTAMAGTDGAAIATDLLLVAAPVAHGAALVAVTMMARAGKVWRALAATTSILAMWLLPPVVGFALYFAVFHSPQHIREVLAVVTGRPRSLLAEAASTFLLATGLIILFAALVDDKSAFPAVGSAVFMVLFVLTVPHMIVPRIVERLVSSRPGALSAASAG